MYVVVSRGSHRFGARLAVSELVVVRLAKSCGRSSSKIHESSFPYHVRVDFLGQRLLVTEARRMRGLDHTVTSWGSITVQIADDRVMVARATCVRGSSPARWSSTAQ